MTEEKKIPGLIPQKDGSYAILIECVNGCITPEVLAAAQQVQSTAGATLHMTTAQKLMFLDMDHDNALKALEILESAGAAVRKTRDVSQPRVCVGKPYCPIALQETFPLGEALCREAVRVPIPPKMKVGVSGCPACCSWANIMDVGFVGYRNGYKVLVGGHGGYRPKPGTEIGTVSTHGQAVEVVKRAAALFSSRVEKKGRFDKVVAEMGVDAVKAELGL